MGEEVGEKSTSERSSVSQVFRIKAVHYMAFFILFYVGVEVSIGGTLKFFLILPLTNKLTRFNFS